MDKTNNGFSVKGIFLPLCTTIYNVGNTSASYLYGLKYILSETDICGDFPAGLFLTPEEPEKGQIRSVPEELNYCELL